MEESEREEGRNAGRGSGEERRGTEGQEGRETGEETRDFSSGVKRPLLHLKWIHTHNLP